MSKINLSLLEISPNQASEFSYEQGSVCLLFSHASAFSMPVNGKTMPFPVFSNYLFFEQEESYPFTFNSNTSSFCIILSMKLEMLHEVLSGLEVQNLPVEAMAKHKSYHKFGSNTPGISACLLAMKEGWNNKLIRESKKYELLNVYFNQKPDKVYTCPFLNQKENVEKVREAKTILISDLQNAPTIKDLAKAVAMNEHSLKSGFKEIFGLPIHAYLKNHKMTVAKGLLLQKQQSVNEIAETVGYSNVSHFIEAFKNKYKQTPKQFALSN